MTKCVCVNTFIKAFCSWTSISWSTIFKPSKSLWIQKVISQLLKKQFNNVGNNTHLTDELYVRRCPVERFREYIKVKGLCDVPAEQGNGGRNNLGSWEFIAITCRNIYGSSTLHLLSTTGRLGPSYILLQCLALLTNILQGIQTHTHTHTQKLQCLQNQDLTWSHMHKCTENWFKLYASQK